MLRTMRAAIAAALFLAPAAAAWAQPVPPPAPPPPAPSPEPVLDIWMLDVGQGSCVYVECPDRAASLLVDCGSTREGGTPLAAVASWLDGRIAGKVRHSVVISHGDLDHYSLIARNDIGGARTSAVFLGGVRADYPGKAAGWLAAVERRGGTVTVYPAGASAFDDPSFACAPARIDILAASTAQAHPEMSFASRKNADSALVRVGLAGWSVILSGDAEGITQETALANAEAAGAPLLGTAIVMGSHHGARTAGSNDAAWADALQSPIAAFSASVDASFRHPQCEVVGRYDRHATRVGQPYAVKCGVGRKRTQRVARGRILSTYGNGHIRVRITPSGMTVYCVTMTAACDAQLDPADAPR